MASEVRGVVAKGRGEPTTLETIVVPDPGPGEAVVKVQACGVCHTDLHYREGGINDDFPFLLGHEAAGVVESVGAGVESVAPGDFVVLNWRAVCGECRSCKRGRPWYCFNTHNATPEDDPHRRHAAHPGPRDRRVRRKDLGRSRAVHQGEPLGSPRGGRPAGMRGDGRPGVGHAHRRSRHRRLGRSVRLWRRRLCRDRRGPTGRSVDDHRDRPRSGQAHPRPRVRSDRRHRRVRRRTRSRRCRH